METRYYLGCSGFYYDHWRGKFYPNELARSKWLPYYTRHFNTLEANNTFYRFPTDKLLSSWYQKTPENFTFTLKANRAITHTRKFHNTQQLTATFYRLARALYDKLLCVLFQLPPFVHKNMELLQTISDQLDSAVLNVLEFRHSSWWDKEVYNFMERHGIIFCSVSASELPDTLISTGSTIYLRFHGKNGWYAHNYPEEELKGWAQKIRAQNSSQVLCYFNNDFNANATRNCQTLRKLLEIDGRATKTAPFMSE